MTPLDRAHAFCDRFGLRVPIVLAPMAGVPAPALSIAVGRAGGMGSCGVLMMRPDEIVGWVDQVRTGTSAPLLLNTWVPDPAPQRDAEREDAVRAWLASWGPPVAREAGDGVMVDFAAQCQTLLRLRPAAISSVMGLFEPDFVGALRAAGIAWFATVTTVAEARQAEAAGADVLVVQGAEAGGHRGAFNAADAEAQLVGLFALLPAVVDVVHVPVVAAGAIVDGRTIAAALMLGASAVQIGTGFLRCPEAGIAAGWADALAHTDPEQTRITRAFSGRAGRSVATAYVLASQQPGAPSPAAYPVQRGFTSAMRKEGSRTNDINRIQAWAGQAAKHSPAVPAGDFMNDIWAAAQRALMRCS